MKNSQAKKQENRGLILEAAGRLFRERGIENVSVAEVMQAAGMTHGGFYRHFADKDDLVAETITHVLGGGGRREPLPADLDGFVAAYLSPEHRDDPATGCIFAALGSETVRESARSRRLMTDSIRRQFDAFAQTAAGSNATERRRAAIGIRSALLGAMLLSRISDDPALAREILDETQAWLKAKGKRAGTARPAASNR